MKFGVMSVQNYYGAILLVMIFGAELLEIIKLIALDGLAHVPILLGRTKLILVAIAVKKLVYPLSSREKTGEL
jgi:hypothetical protein